VAIQPKRGLPFEKEAIMRNLLLSAVLVLSGLGLFLGPLASNADAQVFRRWGWGANYYVPAYSSYYTYPSYGYYGSYYTPSYSNYMPFYSNYTPGYTYVPSYSYYYTPSYYTPSYYTPSYYYSGAYTYPSYSYGLYLR
jgi:hypothetical protein